MKKTISSLINRANCAAIAILGAITANAELVKEPIYDAENVSVGYKVTGLENGEVAMVYTNHLRTATWTVPEDLENVEFLAVGGGGGAGGAASYNTSSGKYNRGGAGGGGGGVVTGLVNFVSGSIVTIQVGAGGEGGVKVNNTTNGTAAAKSAGGKSSFSVNDISYVIARGGGRDLGLGKSGGYGASNAGSRTTSRQEKFSWLDTDVNTTYITSFEKLGNYGGKAYSTDKNVRAGAGGGGATEEGYSCTDSDNAAKGGKGLASDITGVSAVYGSGGGGGSGYNGVGAKGGSDEAGVGGSSSSSTDSNERRSGLANYGGGGGGAGKNGDGGNGGSGIVVFRYKAASEKPVVVNPTYNGSEQVGVIGEGFTVVSGTVAATEVGTYKAIVRSTKDTWADGTTGDFEVTWKILPRMPNASNVAAGDGYIVRGLGDGNEVAVVFTNENADAINWTVPTALNNAQFLVVGGGGGGGADNSSDSNERIAGAGGGGGGVVTGLVNFDKEAVVSITVGAGGSGGRLAVDASDDSGYGGAYNGEASIFGVDGTAWVTAFGGGSDQGADTDNAYVGGKNGSAGGSGAGGRANANGGAETQGDVNSVNVTSSHKYGFPGGNGCTVANGGYGYGAAGGGGGATAPGSDGTKVDAYKGGDGGAGLTSDITGVAKVYGSGGGGSSTWNSAGIGGEGAGDGVVEGNGKNALANQGGGGGGSSRKAATGGNGGSGIVVFRFVYPEVASVDGYGYLDLGEAISAADAGETVTLLANAGNIELGKSIALNLNGCTVDQITLTGTDVTLTAPEDLEVKTSVDGYEVAYDDGVYSLQKVAVVQIGETTYATLAEAVAAAQSGDTIVLIENVELAETVTIPVGKTLTIDLNGKSISMEESIVTTAYALNNLGTLTLKDSVGTGSVNARGIYNGYGNGADNVATAKIIIQSGTYNAKGTNGGAAIFNYGIAEINGGSFTSIGGYSLNNQAGSSMTIADGVTANNGIYCSNAKVTVNGGNISGNRSGCHVVYAWNAELTINGGTFYNNNSGNATIMSAGTTKCTITGGTFGIKDGRVEGNGNTWTSCLTDTANTATMTVTGGIFNGGFRVQAGTTMTIEGGSFNDVGGSGYNIYGTASVKGGTFTDSTAQNFAKANLADGFELNVGGNVVEISAVAQIGETKYATLSAAFAAVTDDAQTVTILKDVTENLTGAYLRGNITTENDAKVMITLTNSDWVYCPYTFVLGANVTLKCPALFYYAGGAQINGKLIVDAYYQRYAGTKLTINEPGSMTVTTEQFYLRYTDGDANAGIYINGDNDDSTIGLNTSVIYFYQGMINAKNANIKTSVYWQTNETDSQGSANLVLDNSKLNVTVNEQKVKATGNSTVTLTNGSELIAPGGFEVGGVLKSSCDITGAISKISDQATIEISGGTYTQDVSDWCVEGYAAVKTLDNKYVVSAMPTATVSNLGSITVGLGDYTANAYMMYDIINGGKLQEATVPYDLTLAMDFKAKDTAETAAQNAFGNYTTDFFITMSGMSQASFVGDGCYLAGYYPSFKAWVKIPLDGFTVENGKVYPVITTAGFDFKYTDICGTVGQFICGIYLTPEVLAANPNLTVDLTLGLAENKDAALNAQFLKVDNYVYDVDDLVTLPEVVITDIKNTLTDADPDLTFALNFAIKDVDKLSEEYLEKLFAKYGDYYTDYVLTISGLTDPNGSVKFNANGNGDGYLAGQYDAWSTNWVTVPFSDVTVTNGQSFYIMEYAAELMNKGGLRLTLKEIAEIVKNFDCGVYFTPEFLAANPNLKVELELKVFTEDENGNKVGDISVATNTFDKDDFSVEAAKLDIRIVNGKPQIGFAGEGKLVLNAATVLTGEWTKNIEYTLVENDGDDTKTWVTPAEGYYFFKGFITK